MNTTGKIITAAAIGAVAGAAAALLLAPAKGSETRKKLGRNLRDGVQKGKDQLEDLKGHIENGLKKVEKYV